MIKLIYLKFILDCYYLKYLTSFRVGQSNTLFTFSFSILIFSSSITTFKNPTSLTFHLYFSGFTYKSFSTNLFTISSTSLYSSFSSVPTIMLSMKLTTFSVLIKSQRISFIIICNITKEFISLKNITVGSNNPSRVVNTAFHSSSSFIYILL